MTWLQYWSFCCVVVHRDWVGGEPIPTQSLSRLCDLCFRHSTIARALDREKVSPPDLADLLSPLKTSLSLLTVTVGIATVYGLQTHRTDEHRVAAPVVSLDSSKVDMILRLQWQAHRGVL